MRIFVPMLYVLKSSAACIAVMLGCLSAICAQTEIRAIRPSDTNADIATFDADSHYVYWSNAAPLRNILVVHLPGTFGEPKRATYFGQWAAGLGFHSVGLMYPNAPTVGSFCSNNADIDCFENVRREIIQGIDFSPDVDIASQECILARTVALLQWLILQYPDEHWDQYLSVDGQLVWEKIMFSGHSQGGGHAAMIARDFPIVRALCFSSPKDWSNVLAAPAPWLSSGSWSTDMQRLFCFNHVLDEHTDRQLLIWDSMGLNAIALPELVDWSVPPYNGTRQLETDFAVPAGDEHGCTLTDNKTPIEAGLPAFGPVWTYMLVHDLPSGVAEFFSGDQPIVVAFPNPCAADQLHVRASWQGMLSVYDAMGRIRFTKYLYQPTMVCEVAHWPSGMYTLVFDTGRQRLFTKWVKQ